jgi:hypothetical protein
VAGAFFIHNSGAATHVEVCGAAAAVGSGGDGGVGTAAVCVGCKMMVLLLYGMSVTRPCSPHLTSTLPPHLTLGVLAGGAIRPSSAVTLDVAWLPEGLTSLKLAGISLSCRGHKAVAESSGAAFAALLLEVRMLCGSSCRCGCSWHGTLVPSARELGGLVGELKQSHHSTDLDNAAMPCI